MRSGARELELIITAFALSPTEAAWLFRVPGQAVNVWMHEGVPLSRIGEVARVAQAAEALLSLFKAERLPEIVRHAMLALGQRSILDTIATSGTKPIFELVEGLRSWSPSAESIEYLGVQQSDG